MCNLSDLIEEKGIEKGIAKGEARGDARALLAGTVYAGKSTTVKMREL